MASPPKKKKRASDYRRKFGTMRYERIQTKIVFQERAKCTKVEHANDIKCEKDKEGHWIYQRSDFREISTEAIL